ncbi:hypothetical protein LTR84_007783 [Exophiala bonariae]|uniref:SnoaL-like domain-containing protein n=1 Tax=Exophiala bonariae TaxID=1690606 RepID=A0AAV9NL20_9EURO|nr:hypothetical protein LTR84_007783 [Exophiala bonariae]
MALSTKSEGAVEALVRYTGGLDFADSEQLGSAFTSDAILDLTKFSKLGMEIPILQGREAIVQTCMQTVGIPLDTTHSLSNFQFFPGADDDQLRVKCYAEAQHFRKGQGLMQTDKDHYWSKSLYVALLTCEAGVWSINHLVIEPVWSIGNVAVLSELASGS